MIKPSYFSGFDVKEPSAGWARESLIWVKINMPVLIQSFSALLCELCPVILMPSL